MSVSLFVCPCICLSVCLSLCLFAFCVLILIFNSCSVFGGLYFFLTDVVSAVYLALILAHRVTVRLLALCCEIQVCDQCSKARGGGGGDCTRCACALTYLISVHPQLKPYQHTLVSRSKSIL